MSEVIAIAGGTGTLGSRVVKLLSGRGLKVRLLARDPSSARSMTDATSGLVEIVPGDVRERSAVEKALAGAGTVISAISAFGRPGAGDVRDVDDQGNRNLIEAAEAAGVNHFIFVSIHGAAPDSDLELSRIKYRIEGALKASRLAWTIIRPTPCMELWAGMIGQPLLAKGKTRIFGRGRNPINFVSADDVARFVELAVVDPTLRGVTVEVGGPENLSLTQVAHVFESVTGKTGSESHVPLPMMRAMSAVMGPFNPSMARLIKGAIHMDTTDMSFDPAPTTERYPSIRLTGLEELVRRDYAKTA